MEVATGTWVEMTEMSVVGTETVLTAPTAAVGITVSLTTIVVVYRGM